MKTIAEIKEKYPELLKTARMEIPEGWETLLAQTLRVMGKWLWYDGSTKKEVTALDFVRVIQVKEKFGGLRLYFDLHSAPHDHLGEDISRQTNERLRGVVDFAESLSYTICQDCGEPGVIRNINGYYATLCDKHHEAELNRRK